MRRVVMRRVVKAFAALLATALVAACGSGDAPAPSPADPKPVAEPPPAPPPDPVPDDRKPILSAGGTADIRVGMTVEEVRDAGYDIKVEQPPEEGSTCTYARMPALKGLHIMLDGERLVRFDVDAAEPDPAARAQAWVTPEGAGYGATEANLRDLYGDRLEIEPHPYGGPEDFYARVRGPADARGMIFELIGGRVADWRAGEWEQVQWIEGCS